ncbi:MAG: sensor histidine kinase [Aristaeellaceae bacterium]
MLRYLRNLSLKYKIFMPFFLFLLLMAFTIYLYGQKTANETILSNAGISNSKLIEQVITSISFLKDEVEDISTQLIIQPTIQQYLQSSSEGESKDKLYVDMNVRNAVNLIATKEYISELAIIGFTNNTVPLLRGIDARFCVPETGILQSSPILLQALEANGKPVWFDSRDMISVFTDNPTACMMMVRIVKDYNTYQNLGLMVMTISQRGMKSLFSQTLNENMGAIAVLNASNERLFDYGNGIRESVLSKAIAHESEADGNGWFVCREGKESYLIAYNTENPLSWKFYYSVSARPLLVQTAESIRYLFPAILAACLFFSFLFALLSAWLTRPMKKLLSAMQSFQTGNFETQLHFKSHDEIGQLGDGFNQMVDNIRSLIDHVYKLELREREAELMALQAQINPHFLYNTLDAIYWKSVRANEQEIADMVLQLSRLFRVSLAKGKKFDRLENELAFLNDYLKLQKLRYGKKLSYTVHADPACLNGLVPHMLLQPIVENAVYHGIEEKLEDGLIETDCRRLDDHIEIRITDNGRGMQQDTALSLENGGGNGYGLKNVYERLQLIYDSRFDFRVESIVGQGTTITLHIPYEEMKEAENDSSADR